MLQSLPPTEPAAIAWFLIYLISTRISNNGLRVFTAIELQSTISLCWTLIVLALSK